MRIEKHVYDIEIEFEGDDLNGGATQLTNKIRAMFQKEGKDPTVTAIKQYHKQEVSFIRGE